MTETKQANRETPAERQAAIGKAKDSFNVLAAMDLPTRDFVRLLRKALQSLVSDGPEAGG